MKQQDETRPLRGDEPAPPAMIPAAGIVSEETAELEAEAQARSGIQIEEAERWGGVDTSDEAVREVMTRAVVEIIVKDDFEKQLRSGRKLRVKLGIDPTGPLLHIGRSVPLFKLRQFQQMGHQIVLIIGDGTALVGDASDKDSERPILTSEQIEQNMATYKEQIGRILDLDKVEFRYNGQWLLSLGFKDVIRLASKFTVAQMIQRENFSNRWDEGKPIGLHEILYPLMQGFDSVAINADVEIGGTDQLFNLMAGRALQEDFNQPPQAVLTVNMIPGTDGRKMSTSWGNAVWILDEPRDQFGKIMSMGDHVIPTYFESVTTVPMTEVKVITGGIEDGSIHPMDAKKRLAWEIVKLYHGEEAADRAKSDFEKQFQERGVPTDIPTVPLARVLGDKANEAGELGILDLLINTGLAPNRKQAQRLVEQGGVKVDEDKVTDRTHSVNPAEGTVIKAGRNFVRITA
ncbi:MAG: tyrosine--tRNA ligase [Chloroflexota bacterium]